MEHEVQLIRTFVIQGRQDRYQKLIATTSGRGKLRSYIAHFKDLETKYCRPVNSLQSHTELHALLKSEGAPDLCYIISENSEYDMRSLPLTDATNKLFLSGIAFFISCIPGKLAYYEGEDAGQRFILKT